MKPSQRYQEITKKINICMKLIGFEVLIPQFKYNYRSWITMIAVMCYGIFTFQRMLKQAQINWTEFMKSIIMIGAMFNGVFNILSVSLRQPEMRRLILNTQKLFEDYEQRRKPYCDALNSGIDRLLVIEKMLRSWYVVSYFVMCLMPLVFLVYDGTRMTIAQYELPGVSLDNNYGYAFTYIVHLISMIIAGVGFYAADLLGILSLMQILTYSSILQLKSQELNDAIQQMVKARRTAIVGATIKGCEELQYKLLESIKWHQYFKEYCHSVDYAFHIIIAGQVVSSAISMLSTFCVNLTEFNLISVIFFLVSSYKMLVYCVVGSKTEYAYDEVYESICSINWYELNGSQRKMFVMMLKEAQNSQTIILLGILPLSVRTALQITKLIYSLSMMVMRNRT